MTFLSIMSTSASPGAPPTLPRTPTSPSLTPSALPSLITNAALTATTPSSNAPFPLTPSSNNASLLSIPSTSVSPSLNNEGGMSASFLYPARSRRGTGLTMGGPTMTGTLFKKKGNASLYKITSVLMDGKAPVVWKERDFTLSDDGILSYSKPPKTKGGSLDLKDAVIRLTSPVQDQYGQYHVHVHTFDGAPAPFVFEVGSRTGLDAAWSLCARSDREMMDWIVAMMSHMFPLHQAILMPSSSLARPHGESLSDPQLPTRSQQESSAVQVERSMSPSLSEQVSSANSKLLFKPSFPGGQQHQHQLLRLGEIVSGFGALNILLLLILYSPPSSIEAWLFAGAINLLVSFGVLVRMEQMLVGGGGGEFPRSMPSMSMMMNNIASSSSRAHTMNSKRQQQQHQTNSNNDDESDNDEEEDVTHISHPDQLLQPTIGTRNRKPALSTSLKPASGNNAPESKHSYSPVDARTMSVRVGPNYRKEGKKAPSDVALMNLVGCDLYYSDEKIDFVTEKIVLPEPSSATGSQLDGQAYRALPGNVPHFFVFNIQIQKAGGAIFGARGGSGYSLVFYFEPSEAFLQELSSPEQCSNASKLVQRWLTTFHTDSTMRERLKLKATVLNTDTCELSPWVLKYNGKPAMITKSNTMSRLQGVTRQGRTCDVVECDVDLRQWNILFRQGLNSVFPIVGKLSVVLALVVQGESDDELPERVLGGVQINYLDISAVNVW